MKKLIIGITGSLGTGKSTVARMFKALGAYSIDADSLARKAMRPGGRAYKKTVSLFGTRILKPSGAINRPVLAGIVFSNIKKLKALNALIHPIVKRDIRRLISKTRKKIVLIDVPLLIESGMKGFVDILIVVKTTRGIQLARCLRKGLTKTDIRRRIECQLPLAKKIKSADFIIDNSGNRSVTKKRVRKIWQKLKR